MSECPYEADCDATAELCRTLRQEIERLTAANTRVGHRLVEAEQRTAELEAGLCQALRLHLAVSPDDPVLITPVEQQLVAMRQERDEARSQRDFAKEDRDLYYQRWEAATQREARLREALDKAIKTQRCFADEWRRLIEIERAQESEYALFVLNQFKQQALSQLPTASSTPTGSDHSETPS